MGVIVNHFGITSVVIPLLTFFIGCVIGWMFPVEWYRSKPATTSAASRHSECIRPLCTFCNELIAGNQFESLEVEVTTSGVYYWHRSCWNEISGRVGARIVPPK